LYLFTQPEVIALFMFLHSMCKVVAVHLHFSASRLVDWIEWNVVWKIYNEHWQEHLIVLLICWQ